MDKYIYKLVTPFGVSHHIGEGDTVQWPKSLRRKAWFWATIGANIRVYRTKVTVKSNEDLCFNWPARKLLWKNKKSPKTV